MSAPCDPLPVVADLPAGAGWEYGGFSYGLEPLTLPPPGAPDRRPEPEWEASYAETCRRISRMAEYGVADHRVERCHTDHLYWFRWITGHQVSFVLWRLLAQVVDEVRELHPVPDTAYATVSDYVHGYSAMLLYTGSCPCGTYQRVIRPSMQLRHPGFSGTWAPDYAPVKELFRARLPAFLAAESVQRAVRLHQLVHTGISSKLVPDGRSLLQQSDVRRQDVRLLQAIYDSYFMTLRAPVSRHEVVAQLLRRLDAIAQDMSVNGFTVTDDERPPTLREPDVVRCGRDFGAIIARVAARAARLWPGLPGNGSRPAASPARTAWQ